MLSGQILAHHVKFHRMSATMGAQLVTAIDLPASGAYVDVSPYIRYHIVAHLGVIDTSDDVVLTPICSDAIGGTPDTISATIAHTVDPDADDQDFVIWTIEVSSLPTDHHWVALDVAAAANASYADVFLLGEVKSLPAVQTETVLPLAGQYYYMGGVAVAES